MELAVVDSCLKLQHFEEKATSMLGNFGNGDITIPSVQLLKYDNASSINEVDLLEVRNMNAIFSSSGKPNVINDMIEQSSFNQSSYWDNNSPPNSEPISQVFGKTGYEDEAVPVKVEDVIINSPVSTIQSFTPIRSEKLTYSQQSSVKSSEHQSDVELQCSAMVYPPFGNSSVTRFTKKEDVLLDVRGNQNQGLGSSMGWAGHHSLVHFDSLKVVPELLVERIRQEDSLIRDVFQNGSFQISSHKSKCTGSASTAVFQSQWGISSGGVKSLGGSNIQKQSGCAYDRSNSIHSAIRRNFKLQNEHPKNAQSVSTETNYPVRTSSNLGKNMNSNFMCRTMFLMNDNLQNNSRVHPKNIFSTPSESGPFIDPKCNFDSNSFCCGSNGLVFTDKHVVAKHQLTACGVLQPPVPVEDKRAAPAPQQGGVPSNSSPDQRPAEDKCLPKPKERPFSCEECGKSFLLKHHLTTHTRVHTGERPYICSECGKSFAHKHCLVTHQRLHTGERPYTCLECKKSFTLKHHLVTHTRVHSRDRPFACEECGRTFSQKRHLVTHSKLHTGERPFACEECGESFSQKEHLTTHSRFHGGERPYVCPDCGNAFQRKFQLVSHARLHGKRPYSCHLCGKEFLQKRTLIAHTRLHTGERPFACQHCGEAFGRKCELAVHSRAAHTAGGRSFACRECGNCFASREGLALHLRLHAGERSLVSDLCGLAFPVDRTSPVRGIGMVPEGRLGAAPSGLVPENRCPPIAPSLPHKPHLCLQCGKSFAQKHGLVQHTKRHSGEKPHSCIKCGKAFAQKYSLSLHSRLHPPTDEPSQPIATSPSISSPTAMLHSSPPVIEHSSPPSIQHSSSSTIQHSGSPAIQLSSTPSMQHSSPPSIQHANPPEPPSTPSGDATL